MMAKIKFEYRGVQVDAAVIGKGLGIGASAEQPLLRQGKITSRHERGEGADVGRSRFTFFLDNRCFHIIVDETGQIIRRCAIDFGDRCFPRRCGGQTIEFGQKISSAHNRFNQLPRGTALKRFPLPRNFGVRKEDVEKLAAPAGAARIKTFDEMSIDTIPTRTTIRASIRLKSTSTIAARWSGCPRLDQEQGRPDDYPDAFAG